jgi:phosphoribosyl 1,2-cyclic phosphodiesterase
MTETAPVRPSICVQFWGVRGSIPCPGPNTVRYGGNTPCVEVRCGEHLVVFDAGTGLRALGDVLLQRTHSVEIDILLSHCHIDHMSGLPFFGPAFVGGHVRLWAGNLLPEYRLEEVVRRIVSPPVFPIAVETFKAEIEYRDFAAGAVIELQSGIVLRTAPLDHPDGATGYRLEYGGRSIAYVSDTESRSEVYDRNIVSLARDVDLMIFDCTYDEREIASHYGWGHSTLRQGLRLADKAGARQFCAFHHDPSRSDDALDRMAAEAVAARPGTIVAREGLALEL